MYSLYHIRAFILGGAPFGEGNKLFTLFSDEFGLVTASATSVRFEKSKLRFGLQDFSFSEVVLVRGKRGWRITGVSLIENICVAHKEHPETIALFGRVFCLLRRLLHGEEKNARLFSAVFETYLFLKNNPKAALAEVEVVLVLRILYALGYLAPRSEFDEFLADTGAWNESVLSKALQVRDLALSHINLSLRETQL